MTKHEQSLFLDNFLMQVRDHLMTKVAQMPEEWDGIELRQYVADAFNYECLDMNKARKSAYKVAKYQIA